MDDIYRSLGRERELELLRDAERLHAGARARAARRELGPSSASGLRLIRTSLRRRLRRVGETLRPARSSG